ncbi:hypothetical protein OAE29_07570, partial [Octadecabacter sp.]|nr:hypothetical protein [Octadecabacter sp.]
MNGTYRSANDPYLWYIYGGHTHAFQWGEFFAGGSQFDSQWLTLSRAGFNRTGELPFINLSSNLPSSDGDVRLEDRLTLDFEGTQYAVIKNVEYVDSTLDTATSLRTYGHSGFATDASLESIYANVGNHEMSFTAAIKDNSLHLGDGGDAVNLVDHFDIPGQQYWSLIRQDGHQLDAYSLLTGRKIRMEDGQESLNGLDGYHNFGEVEWLHLENARSGETDTYIPGQEILEGGDRGVFENIDLRTVEMVVDGGGYTATSVEFSDSFNLAYFNFIRYTSDNVWVGEATVSDGTNFSAASDRTVDVNKNVYLKSGYTVDAPVLDGQLSVIGQSRNGTHDLMVAEQASEIDGNLRLYTSQLETGLYNEFNQVFLGTSADDSSDKSIVDGSDWSDRVALYGFGGEDVLKAGAGRDYLFGGQSVYNQLNSDETGNKVTGGTGADYFGVGNTDSFGEVFGANSTIGTSATTGEFHQGYATDVIMDWHAEQDTVVVLSNGVAVIAGLRDESDVVSLNVGNTIDLRDYTAIATSDQDFDGARGGDDWDQIKSLDYIYSNQTTRDGNSITNEVDKTVVNDGLIVARGLDGDDTLHGSSGDDYLYGNKGADLLTLSAGGTDRVYIDTFDSALVSNNFASIYVADFEVSDDQVFVNKGVVDAFYSGGSGRALSASDVTGTYLSAVAYDTGINFLHDKFYSPSIYDTNESHRNQDGAGAFGDNSGSDTSSSFGGGDGTSFGIGAGMFAAGTVLMFVPFMGPVGAALMASGTALGAGSSIISTTEHENATFSGNVGSYMNIITSDTLEAVTTSAATESVRNTDDVRFLDFFGASDAGDGFVPVVEFTAHAGEGIYGYFALHSAGGDDETFVYLVASSDNLVENSEAIKVAEVNGHLTAADFKVYDGEEDIYNVGAEPDIILRTPTLVSVVDQNGDYGLQLPDDSGNSDNNDALIEKGGTPSSNSLSIGVELSGVRVTGTIIKIYDGTTLIFSGDENTNTEDSGGNVTAVYDNSTNRFEISDGRSIGTVAFDSQVDPVTYQQNDPLVIDGVDNNFVLQDSIVNYSIELIDGVTGISTRAGSGAITVSGGDNVIDGGTETSGTVLGDMLNITGTNDYINSTSDSNIVDIETILLSAMDTNGTGDDDTSTGFGDDGTPAIDDEDDGTTLNLSNQSDGFFVYGSSIADIITGSTGDDDINGMGGGDIIQLTSIGASLSTSGADRVRFVYSTDGDDADTVPDRMGADTGYDIIAGMYSDDELFVEASSSNAPSTPLDGFDDRDGDTNRLLYETASGSENMQVASGTELLVLAASSVSASGDLTNNIASALESAFDVSGLDGNTPSNTSGGVTSTDSSLLFAVQSDVAGTYWFGRYEDQNNDDTIDGDTDIEVFANVATTDLLESFWLDTVLAPQALTINLPDDTFSLSPTYATNVATFSVGGLASGNSVYYSVNGGTDWNTSTDSSGLALADGTYSAGAIKVRQLDGSGNYSP